MVFQICACVNTDFFLSCQPTREKKIHVKPTRKKSATPNSDIFKTDPENLSNPVVRGLDQMGNPLCESS